MTHGSVPNVDELRELAPHAYDTVTLEGYYDPGDGGGGEFTWVGTPTRQQPSTVDDGIVFAPNDPGDHPDGRWHREPSRWLSVKWFGAKGDGVTNDSDAIQRAECALMTRVLPGPMAIDLRFPVLEFPPGTYVIGMSEQEAPDSKKWYGVYKYNTHWIGEEASPAVLKLADGSVTPDCDPQMIFADGRDYGSEYATRLELVRFQWLRFDLNRAGNLGLAHEQRPKLAEYNTAAIWFNGDALKLRHVYISHCRFENGPGANVILIQNRAQEEFTDGYPLTDVYIEDCQFYDNRNSLARDDPDAILDHSTVNSFAERTHVRRCQFVQTEKSEVSWAATCAEFHASDCIFGSPEGEMEQGNSVQSYGRVVVASQNLNSKWQNLRVADNVADDLGVNFLATDVDKEFYDARGTYPWRAAPLTGVVVVGNVATFNAETVRPSGNKSGVYLQHWGTVGSVKVIRNRFSRERENRDPLQLCAGVHSPFIGGTTPPGRVDELVVEGNTFTHLGFGGWFDNAGSFVRVEELEFVDNHCCDLHDEGVQAHAAGLFVGGPIGSLEVRGNHFDNRGADSTYRTYTTGVWVHPPTLTVTPPLDAEPPANTYSNLERP